MDGEFNMITSWNEILVKDYTNSGTTWYGDRGVFTSGTCNNSTRGLFAGHGQPLMAPANIIEYITIQVLGTAKDFGDLWTTGEFRGTAGN